MLWKTSVSSQETDDNGKVTRSNNIRMNTLSNVKAQRDIEKSQCIGFTSDASPEVQQPSLVENSQTGVSTKNVLSGIADREFHHTKVISHWYVLRTTYGREKKAYDYFLGKGVEAFYPTLTSIKLVNGKRKSVTESRIPNIFFAYGTEEEIKKFVYDNINLPYLRFYYRHLHEGSRIIKEPLIVPVHQIESLKIICASEKEDIIIVPSDIKKFKHGQKVRIIGGSFKGVIGNVARYHGQQRVAVILDGLLTIATAYIPSAFLEIL